LTALKWIRVPGGTWQVLAGGGALFTESAGPGATVISRVDPATGRVGPATRISGAVAMAYGGGLLWITRGAPRATTTTVLALDPVTLTVRRTVTLPEAPGLGTEELAYAGGVLWVATSRTLIGIDPVTAMPARRVPVTAEPGGSFTEVAASADGTALWTSEDSGGGGPIAVQLRNPDTGAELAATSYPAGGLGGAQIAAAGGRAWLAYATGNLGSYFEATSEDGRLTETRPPAGSGEFTNSVRVYLAGQQLWITDGMSGMIACAAGSTGRILQSVYDQSILPGNIASLSGGRVAMAAAGGYVLIARPKPACGP
jgi:hypothetical protein